MRSKFISRLTSKCQVTIPVNVRKVIGLKQGEFVEFDIQDNTVILKRPKPIDFEYLKLISNNFSEWNSKNDDDAYGSL